MTLVGTAFALLAIIAFAVVDGGLEALSNKRRSMRNRRFRT